MMRAVYNYLAELFGACSCLLNALTGDSRRWALSSRAHRDRIRWLETMIDVLFIWQGWGHCRRWYDDHMAQNAAELAEFPAPERPAEALAAAHTPHLGA